MRNANESEVLEARRTGILKQDLMYLTGSIPYKVHGKDVEISLAGLVADDAERYGMEGIAIAETDSGRVIMVQTKLLKPVATGPSQQTKRSKRKPVKGTRPETLIPMSSDVKLKVGDKVVLADGTRSVVTQYDEDDVDAMYWVEDGVWCDENGSTNISSKQENITHKIIPWTPPAPNYKPEDVAFNKAQKCAEEDHSLKAAFDKGYWVTHQSTPDSACPLWARSLEVQLFLQDGTIINSDLAIYWNWTEHADSDNIVAYRKAQQ